MNGIITCNGVSIRYSDKGAGNPVVLLHGYLESLEIWSDFNSLLSRSYRVICVDLPGHGRSGFWNEYASMEDMAQAVVEVLDSLKIQKAVVIGHSMGGYATLAFAELYPDRLAGFGLFHSVCWSDLPEKQVNRQREIDLIKQGKKDLIVATNIPNAFASSNLDSLADEIDKSKIIALQTTNEGIIAALQGMINRKDRTHVLSQATVPVFFGVGLKDNYIPFEKLLELTELVQRKHVAVFLESGHMAFIEEPKQALSEINSFLKICYSA